jgi:hypothetical protein
VKLGLSVQMNIVLEGLRNECSGENLGLKKESVRKAEKLHDRLHILHFLPNKIRMINKRKIR